MNSKIVAVWISLVMVVSFVVIIVEIAPNVVAPTTIYVDDIAGNSGPGDPPEDYTVIQWAIDNASDGDTVFVYNGTYYENVVVDKSINLTGEDVKTTVIDGGGSGDVVRVTAHWANMTGFTVTGSGSLFGDVGIELYIVQNCRIIFNNVTGNKMGILLDTCSDNLIANNTAFDNGEGIRLSKSLTNIVYNNTVNSNDAYGIILVYSHNNDVNENIIQETNFDGIYFNNANNNSLFDNYLSSNDIGIKIDRSTNNTLCNTVMEGDGILLVGTSVEHANTHIIDISNTVNGKPVRYIKDQTGGSVPLGAGQVILANCSNVMVEDQDVSGGTVGFELIFSSNNTFKNSNASNNFYGVYMEPASNNTIYNNTVLANEIGVRMMNSNDNTIVGNDCSYCIVGIFLTLQCTNNTIKNNTCSNSGTTFWGTGIKLSESCLNRIENNKADFNKEYGVHIEPSSNQNTIVNNDAMSNDIGIYVESSVKNSLCNNTISNNNYGIKFESGSSFNLIENNTLYSNNFNGIRLILNTNNNTIANNTISDGNEGIFIQSAIFNTIVGNQIFSNGRGIRLLSSATTDHLITDNTVMNNGDGIQIQFAENNRIYHNHLINNNAQATDTGLANQWDDGYPSGGNFWSDFSGIDMFSGPNQDQPGSDAIGDTNYTIDSDSVDNYPLTSPTGSYIFLYPGWNLISIPKIQSTTNLGVIFGSIEGSYDCVEQYNAADTSDHWKVNSTSKPNSINDLEHLDHHIGLWVHITEPGGILFGPSGASPAQNQTIALHKGWNLVGYPSLSNKNRTKALSNLTFGVHVDSIWTFNAAAQRWVELDEPEDHFEIGRGYWIHAKTKCGWDVPL